MFETPNLVPAIPEMVMLGMICVTLLAELFLRKRIAQISFYMAQLSLIVVAYFTVLQFGSTTVYSFDHSFIVDKLSVLLKSFIYITSFFCFMYARRYIAERNMPQGEYYLLGLISILGMMVLVSAANMLTAFVGLELLSLPIYAMVALRRDAESCTEAAMKYFVTGALATGLLLYGISLIYGATASFDLQTIAQAITTVSSRDLTLVFGLVFVVVGLGFKVGAVPFHMWVPDVYQGSPTSVTLFIGSAAKIAGFGLVIRILIDALPGLQVDWHQLVMVLALLSMAVGNFAAIAQENFKRMLAYSSIAHMGYMLLGLVAGTAQGFEASTFYIITYALSTLGGFGMLSLMSRKGVEVESIDQLKGLNSRNPWLALMMLLVMFSMAGIPPLVGFMAKLMVLEALVKAHFVWLAAVALLFAIVGAYYYIRVVKVMYFEEAEDAPIAYGKDMWTVISINGISLLALGIFPGVLFSLCQGAF